MPSLYKGKYICGKHDYHFSYINLEKEDLAKMSSEIKVVAIILKEFGVFNIPCLLEELETIGYKIIYNNSERMNENTVIALDIDYGKAFVFNSRSDFFDSCYHTGINDIIYFIFGKVIYEYFNQIHDYKKIYSKLQEVRVLSKMYSKPITTATQIPIVDHAILWSRKD